MPADRRDLSFSYQLDQCSPGLIAYQYKTRWDLEKIFDEVKNKLPEKKAWATSDTAKNMQAQFICIAHNLMLILEQDLKEKGFENKNKDNRRRKRLDQTLSRITTCKEKLPIFLKTPKRSTQRPLKFIRWLRHNLYANTSWVEAVGALKLIYDAF